MCMYLYVCTSESHGCHNLKSTYSKSHDCFIVFINLTSLEIPTDNIFVAVDINNVCVSSSRFTMIPCFIFIPNCFFSNYYFVFIFMCDTFWCQA